MSSVALETLRRMGKASKRPSSQEERAPLPVVPEAAKEDELELRLVPLEKLTAIDHRVILDAFGSPRTK